MNWSRGLFRLWVLFAALWVAGCGLYSIAYFSSPFWVSADVGRALLLTQITAFVGMAVIPPAMLFAIGFALLWAARGFRQP